MTIQQRLQANIDYVKARRHGMEPSIPDNMTLADGVLSTLNRRQAEAHDVLMGLVEKVEAIKPHEALVAQIETSQKTLDALQTKKAELSSNLTEKQARLAEKAKQRASLLQTVQQIKQEAGGAPIHNSFPEHLLISAGQLSFSLPTGSK